jgi:NAD(P)-dependent dehydrogenase (short-subunit alcohol dehydrogenase family)
LEAVARGIACLAPDAAAKITGTVLPIDGGWTAKQPVPPDFLL